MQRQRLNRDGVKSQGAYMEPAADGNWVAYAEAAEIERRLALAVAEVKAWRGLWVAMKGDRNGSHTQEVLKNLAAEAATDADPVLRAMIGGGE